jgi:hypothetical protein
MKKYKNYVIVGLCCLLVGRYVLQPKATIEVKEVVKYVEKKQEATNIKKKTVKKETTRPDGSSVTETTIIEDSSSNSSSTIAESKETSKKQSSGKGVTIGVLAIKDIAEFRKSPDIGVLLSLPVIGNLSVTTMADSSKRIGLGFSLEF